MGLSPVVLVMIEIVMEYCHCGSIGTYLRNGNRLKEDELREVVSCCLLGLSYLHNKNIIHRVPFRGNRND